MSGTKAPTPANLFVVYVSDADADGIFVASDNMTTVYGAGTSPFAALKDYTDLFEEEFKYLEEHERQLGPSLQRELATMRALRIPKVKA